MAFLSRFIFDIPASLVPAVALIGFIPAPAQTDTVITSLAQLSQAVSEHDQFVSSIRLKAEVFACNTNTGTLAVQDTSGACLLELDGIKDDLQPGETVEIESKACLLSPGTVGIYVTAAPVLDNDCVHEVSEVSNERWLEAGRHPIRLDWFNQLLTGDLAVSIVPAHLDQQMSAPTDAETNLIHAVRAECFDGFWARLPNFRVLQPVKSGTVTNFDVGFRTREEMAGIRFEGYFDAPRSGKYLINLRSDDGSRLWIGNPEVPVKKIGMSVPPSAPPAKIGERMVDPTELRLATIEGRVTFVSRLGMGLQFEMRGERGSASVVMAHAGSLEPADLLNASVRVSGVAGSVLRDGKTLVLGSLAAVSSKDLTIVEGPPGTKGLPAVLTNVMQVQTLSSNAAANRLPVTIQGTVTAVAHMCDHWMVIQDSTRGSFVCLRAVPESAPKIGQYWSITGYTQPGDFAPVIIAERATLLEKASCRNRPIPCGTSWRTAAWMFSGWRYRAWLPVSIPTVFRC